MDDLCISIKEFLRKRKQRAREKAEARMIRYEQEIEKIHSIIGDKEKNHKEYKEKDNDDKNLFPAREKKEAEDIITHNGQFRKMPDGRIIDLDHGYKTTFRNIFF